MGKLLGYIILGLCIFLAVSALVGAVQSGAWGEPSAADFARMSAEIDRIERERQRAADLAWLDTTLAVAWRVVPLGIVLLALAGATAWGSVALIRFRRERWARADGVLPMPAGLLHEQAPAALAALHDTRRLAAAQAPVPHTYAPHYSHRADVSGVPGDAAALAAPAADPVTFGSLLDRGEIGPGRPIVLGTDATTGEVVYGGVKDLYSAGLGGQQGSGKSWTAASLAAQAMLGGAQVLMIDPHAGDAESLATRMEPLAPYFMADVATNERSAIATLRYAGDILKARQPDKDGKIHDTSRTPVIVLIDEWTALLLREELAKVLPKIIAHINVEGRKFGVVAELLAHRWATANTGGGIVRNTLTACYVHRSRIEEARLLTGMGSATPRDTLTLSPGQAYLVTTRGDMRKVQTPHMTERDITRVAGLLTSDAPTLDLGAKSQRSRFEVGVEVGNSASLSPEAARAVALFRQGINVPDIALEMGLTKTTSGAAAQKANAQVQAWLREAWEVTP